MGHPKQLLKVGGQPMLKTALESLVAAQVNGVVLVTRKTIARQIDLSDLPRVFVAYNENPDSEMIDSVRIGLYAWAARLPAGDHDGFLVLPADHPGISTADIDTCIGAFRAAPDRIAIASRAGRRGHPIIFPAALISFVLSPDCDRGLHALPHTFPERVLLVPCHSAGVTKDVDTPADAEGL
jgi:molybdenum cofactor cytidylyltransferase